MDEEKMIDDLVKMLDFGMANGVGHVNVEAVAGAADPQNADSTKKVETFRSSDCSRTPLACSVPTLHEGLDDN